LDRRGPGGRNCTDCPQLLQWADPRSHEVGASPYRRAFKPAERGADCDPPQRSSAPGGGVGVSEPGRRIHLREPVPHPSLQQDRCGGARRGKALLAPLPPPYLGEPPHGTGDAAQVDTGAGRMDDGQGAARYLRSLLAHGESGLRRCAFRDPKRPPDGPNPHRGAEDCRLRRRNSPKLIPSQRNRVLDGAEISDHALH
jgi:hypothetical protein